MEDYNLFSMVKQTALGAANEALLGFPQYFIDREQKGIFKPEDTKQERFARGLGTFIGFAVGLPAGVIKVGGKAALKLGGRQLLKTGMKRKLVRGALAGAGGFGALEATSAPRAEESYSDKAASIPMAIAIGGALGLASPLITPILQKHSGKLYDNIIKKGSKEEYKNIMERIAHDSTLIVKKADQKFISLLNSEQFGNAMRFASKVYTGSKQQIAKLKIRSINLAAKKGNPEAIKKMANLDYLGKLAAEEKELFYDPNVAVNLYSGIKEAAQKFIHNPIWTSGTSYLENQGSGGKYIARLFNTARGIKEKIAGNSAKKYGEIVQPLKTEELMKYSEVAEGRLIPTKELEGLHKYWNQVRDNIFVQYNRTAKSFGMPLMTKKTNYFPHYLVNPNTPKAAKTEIARAMVQRGEARSLMDARNMMEEYLKIYKTGMFPGKSKVIDAMLAGNPSLETQAKAKTLLLESINAEKNGIFKQLEKHRGLNLPFWDPNPNRVLPRYIASAEARIIELKLLGGDQFKNITKGIAMMEKEGNASGANYARQMWEKLIGKQDMKPIFGMSPETVGKLKEIQVVTKLGLSSIPNATQSVNTALYTGTRNTAKQIANYFSGAKTQKEMADWALRIGSTLESSLNEFYMGSGISGGLAQKFLRKTGFIQIEKFNRVISANAGKSYAQNMEQRLLKNPADKLARRAFKKLGLKPDRIIERGRMSENELIKAAQEVVNKTQFRAGPMDLPLWFSSPEGKLVTQFKSFAFNQAKLFKDLLKDEVSKGNFMPIARMVTLMPIIGEGVKDIRAILSGNVRDEKGLERLLDNASAVGGIGIVADLYQAAKYNAMAGYLAGPTVSDMGKAVTGGIKATQGKPRMLERFILRNTPVIGPYLANTLTPSIRLKSKRKKLEKQRRERWQMAQ